MARTRYRYDPETKSLVQISEDWTDTERRAQTVTEELVYGGAHAPDGTDMSSRKKHREYLARTGMAMASDFKEHTAKAAAARQDRTAERREIHETVGRTMYQLQTQRRRR